MKKFYSFMEEKLVPFTNRVASIPFLVVMRNAMMSLVALLVVGSIAAMIAKLPIDAFQTVMAPVIPLFTAINQATTGMMGLTAAIAVGYYGATQYDVDVVPAMLISTCSFLASQLTEDGLNTEVWIPTAFWQPWLSALFP